MSKFCVLKCFVCKQLHSSWHQLCGKKIMIKISDLFSCTSFLSGEECCARTRTRRPGSTSCCSEACRRPSSILWLRLLQCTWDAPWHRWKTLLQRMFHPGCNRLYLRWWKIYLPCNKEKHACSLKFTYEYEITMW